MKRFLLATTAALFCGAAPALAADLSPMLTKAPAYAPAWTWTGGYFGVNLGGGWAKAGDTETATFPGGSFALSASETLTGVVGGFQMGYNWQLGNVVLGVEGDADGSGQSATANLVAPGGTYTSSDRVYSFGTLRGKLGFAVDRWMIYGTGGLSWQNLGESTSFTGPGNTLTVIGNGETTRWGYAVGGGVAVALWGNFIGGAEYLYLDTGNFSPFYSPALPAAVGPFPAGSVATDTTRVQNSMVRAFVNYKF